MEPTTDKQPIKDPTDFLPLRGTDHIELYVGNA